MVIDSKLNKHSEFSYGKVYLKEIFWSNILLLTSLAIVFQFSLAQIIYALVLFAFFALALIYLLGIKRKRNLVQIQNLIELMKQKRENIFENQSLDEQSQDIQKSLKELFDKNMDDLANIRKLAQARSDFLGNVSHELRTPIFAIKGFLETLLNGAIDDSNVNRRFIEKSIKHTDNLDALLNDLIDISMIESGAMRMKPEFFNIVELVKSVIDEISLFAEGKGISVKTKFFNDKILVLGDREKLKQVFLNLINNGIKYSSKGKVVITMEEEKFSVKISVKDTGPGIPEIDLPRIFERFYRTDKARSKDVEGTGLGLAIVKHIVEAHGSSIKVESKLGKGSVFSFSLRMKRE